MENEYRHHLIRIASFETVAEAYDLVCEYYEVDTISDLDDDDLDIYEEIYQKLKASDILESEKSDSEEESDSEQSDGDSTVMSPINRAYKSRALLSIDASIYDKDYHIAFEKFANNLQHISIEVSNDAVCGIRYLIDNIYGATPEIDDFQVPLMIENEQNRDYAEPGVRSFSDINNILSKTTVCFKVSDFIVDAFRFSSEPTLEHAKVLVRDYIHIQGMIQGSNIYSLSLSAIDIAHHLSHGDIKQVVIQTATTASYTLLPIISSFINIEYKATVAFTYGAIMLAYSGYNAITNIYSLYLNHNSPEYQLKSNIAYGELFDYWGFKDAAKGYFLNATKIVEEDMKFIYEKEQNTEIQRIAEESNLSGMLAYYEIDGS